MLIKINDKLTINIEEIAFVELSEDLPPAARVAFNNGTAVIIPPEDTEKFAVYLDLTTLKVSEIYEKRDLIKEEQTRRKQLLESIRNQEEGLLSLDHLDKTRKVN